MTDPRIIRNGEECPETVCSNIVYDAESNTLTFTVNGFSTYEVIEGYTPPPESSSSGGGSAPAGGGGGGSAPSSFSSGGGGSYSLPPDIGSTATSQTGVPEAPSVETGAAEGSCLLKTPSRSSSLTASQVESIINLLSTFNTAQEVVENVHCALLGIEPDIPTGLSGSSVAPDIVFDRDLTLGDEGQDVKALQVFLNNQGFTIAVTGLGSSGNESTYFGNLTRDALIRFQEAYRSEVLTPGGFVRGTGYFGSLTRKKISSLLGGSISLPSEGSSSVSESFTRDLTIGSEGQDVKALQVFLNNNGFVIAPSGPGSEGNETTFFGNLTRDALIRFQEAYRAEVLTPVDLTQGTGYFGPSTRIKINALLR